MLLAAPALALLLALAGCGSSSDGGWRVLSKRTASGTELGLAAGTAGENPAAIEVRVEAKPDVATQVGYTIDCSGGRHPQTGIASGRTPFTAPVPLPGGRNPCVVSVTASKSAPAEMTVTLLWRATPA